MSEVESVVGMHGDGQPSQSDAPVPHQGARGGKKLVLLLLGIGCGIPLLVVGSCTSFVFMNVITDQLKPAKVHVQLIDNDDGGLLIAKNVSSQSLRNVTGEMDWERYGRVGPIPFGDLASGQEVRLELYPKPLDPPSNRTEIHVPTGTRSPEEQEALGKMMRRTLQTVSDHEFYEKQRDALRTPPTFVRMFSGGDRIKISVTRGGPVRDH